MKDKSKNVPQMRFRDENGEAFPDWEEKRLGEVVKILYGKDHKNIKAEQKLYPVLGTGGIITFIDEYLCDWPCVLIGRKGTIDKPQYMDSAFWSVDTLFYSKPIKGNAPKFQFYLFGRINWKRYDESTGVPSLSASTIEGIKAKIPSLPEQSRIADFFSKIDAYIERQEKVIEKLEEEKQGLMQRIFSQEVRFRDENGEVFPDWEEKRLGEVIEQTTKRNRKGSIRRVLSVSNKLGFILQNEQFGKGLVASDDTKNYKIIEKDSFAYNPARINVGSIALLNDFDIGIVSPMYVCFKCKTELLSSYLYMWIQTQNFNIEVKKRLEGSVRECLSFDGLSNILMVKPMLMEQRRIADFFSKIDELLEKEKHILENWKVLKKGLLQQMFI